MTPKEMKAWIDKAPYQALLEKWRFAPIGSPWFIDDIGIYFDKVMRKKKKEVGERAAVRASKNIGWGR